MKALCIFVVFLLIGFVNADTTEDSVRYVEGKLSSQDAGSVVRSSAEILSVIATIAVGGVGFLAALVVLQYLGIDVIGISIQVFKFFFDNLFLLIRWTLATQENLISMVILFIIFWAILLFGGPAI